VIQLTRRQRRILVRLAAGDYYLWEVAGEKYFTQFEERTGRHLRVHPPALQPLEAANLIYRRRHAEALRKLDYWEITDEGRVALESMLPSSKLAQPAS
jgi:DNA-binding MarR family transcriptional regulator